MVVGLEAVNYVSTRGYDLVKTWPQKSGSVDLYRSPSGGFKAVERSEGNPRVAKSDAPIAIWGITQELREASLDKIKQYFSGIAINFHGNSLSFFQTGPGGMKRSNNNNNVDDRDDSDAMAIVEGASNNNHNALIITETPQRRPVDQMFELSRTFFSALTAHENIQEQSLDTLKQSTIELQKLLQMLWQQTVDREARVTNLVTNPNISETQLNVLERQLVVIEKANRGTAEQRTNAIEAYDKLNKIQVGAAFSTAGDVFALFTKVVEGVIAVNEEQERHAQIELEREMNERAANINLEIEQSEAKLAALQKEIELDGLRLPIFQAELNRKVELEKSLSEIKMAELEQVYKQRLGQMDAETKKFALELQRLSMSNSAEAAKLSAANEIYLQEVELHKQRIAKASLTLQSKGTWKDFKNVTYTEVAPRIEKKGGEWQVTPGSLNYEGKDRESCVIL